MTTIVSIKTNKQKKRYDFACPGLTQVRYRSFYYEKKKIRTIQIKLFLFILICLPLLHRNTGSG